jgi:hypothetical protein
MDHPLRQTPCERNAITHIRERGRAELALHDTLQQGALLRRAPRAVGRLETLLRLGPPLEGGVEPRRALPGQLQFLAARVRATGLDADQPVAFERQEVAPERAAIQD